MAEVTGLSLRTVRTIVGQKNGTGSTKRASVAMRRARLHSPTASSPGCHACHLPLRYSD